MKLKSKILNRLLIKHVGVISKDSLNPELHFELGKKAIILKDTFLALSEFKTAKFLSKNSETKFDNYISKCYKINSGKILKINHNIFYRLKTISDLIDEKSIKPKEKSISVLDVGGGKGFLASFIHPEYNYCLVEPTVNGINGISLPFDDNSSDFVVSCHVLEHVPIQERELFLNSLLRVSRIGVILLNPIAVEGTFPKERLELAYSITKAEWVKEHINCSLPTKEFIDDFGKKNNLEVEFSPNGSMTSSFSLMFMEHFGKKNRKNKPDLEKINMFFNLKYSTIMQSKKYPVAGLFYIKK